MFHVNSNVMKKSILFILIGLFFLCLKSEAQFYGSNTYSYICIQQHQKWCAFACLEMYCKGKYKQAGMKSEQVDRDYGIVVDCGRVTSNMRGYTECMSDIGLWEFVNYANYILNKRYIAYTEADVLFPPGAPKDFYKFPYFGMNVAKNHVVLLIGVKVKREGSRFIRTVHFVDPDFGAVRHSVDSDYPLEILLETLNN